MKKLGIYLIKKKVAILLIMISFFLTGFLFANFYNHERSYYVAKFSVSNVEQFDIEQLNDVDYLNSIKATASKYENMNIESMIKKDGFKVSHESDHSFRIVTKSKYYDTFFNSKTKSVGTRAKTFIKDSVNGLLKENNTVAFENEEDIVILHDYINNYASAGIGALIGFVFALSLFSILCYKQKETKEDYFIYDNVTTFKTCFHKSYFKQAFHSVKNVKDMTNIAMLFALMMICKFIKIPSGFADLGLSFTYLFFAISAMIYGPMVGLVIGAFSDVIGYIMMPDGVFFPLYIIQAALTGMIYGLCLYKTKVSFGRVLLARCFVNFLMNVVFGSLCFGLLYEYSKEVTLSYMLLVSLPKNIVYLLPQSLLLYYVIKMVAPVLHRFHLMDEKIYKNIKLV